MAETPEVDATVQKVETLLEELRQADPKLQQKTEEIIRLLMHLYGSAFTRIIGILGNESAGRLAEDKLVSSLLLLHRLHPVDAESRIQEALLRIERRLDGARLSVTGISDDVARVRVDLQEGSAQPAALAAMIERAVAESAPDVAGVEIEGLPGSAASLVHIAPVSAR